MNDVLSSNEATIDYALLEKVNPVFLTAKMTLFQLAANGDFDAAMLVESMGLTLEETQNSANSTASPEQVLGGTIMLEARYRTMASLAESSGYTLVDLPCGYTPRAIAFARKGLPYYGLDLPVVIREISDQVKAMVKRQKEKYGWEFLFLGANIDAVETASHYGIGADRAVNFHNDKAGQALNYKVVSEAVCTLRSHAPIRDDWKEEIEEDFKSRKSSR